MAVIVLGAGATRGASFVDPTVNPCLPPLDADFHTQLQRIHDPKHKRIIDGVIKDTVELFGTNFRTTMETMFTTLEHSERMLKTTGEKRDFKTADFKEKRVRLQQAIASVFEESICRGNQKPLACDYHDALVAKLRVGDSVVSFNYDCLIDDALKRHGDGKWNAHYGYGFELSPGGGGNLRGDHHWSPDRIATRVDTVTLLKLHGSLHFIVDDEATPANVRLKERPYTRQRGNLRFTIIPPESQKRFDEGVFARLWKLAGRELYSSRSIVVIGYSFPATDLHSTALFRTNTKGGNLRALTIVNPDPEARRRTRDVLQRGIGPQTRVVVFNSLRDFTAADRKVWDP
ncbi:MAG: SIR2 family protein [Dehalococcoidia bacterium]